MCVIVCYMCCGRISNRSNGKPCGKCPLNNQPMRPLYTTLLTTYTSRYIHSLNTAESLRPQTSYILSLTQLAASIGLEQRKDFPCRFLITVSSYNRYSHFEMQTFRLRWRVVFFQEWLSAMEIERSKFCVSGIEIIIYRFDTSNYLFKNIFI